MYMYELSMYMLLACIVGEHEVYAQTNSSGYILPAPFELYLSWLYICVLRMPPTYGTDRHTDNTTVEFDRRDCFARPIRHPVL